MALDYLPPDWARGSRDCPLFRLGGVRSERRDKAFESVRKVHSLKACQKALRKYFGKFFARAIFRSPEFIYKPMYFSNKVNFSDSALCVERDEDKLNNIAL